MPIHKSGNKQNCINYKPISNIYLTSKMFEVLLTKQFKYILSLHFNHNQLMDLYLKCKLLQTVKTLYFIHLQYYQLQIIEYSYYYYILLLIFI